MKGYVYNLVDYTNQFYLISLNQQVFRYLISLLTTSLPLYTSQMNESKIISQI